MREVSGEEALRAHIKDSSSDPAAVVDEKPVLLGERTLSNEGRSIAEVMHVTDQTSDVPPQQLAPAHSTGTRSDAPVVNGHPSSANS